jgi:SulP family sulfate permease
MAYAELAGLPAYVGLYAAALPPIAAAFFASSPYLQTGPGAVTALLSLGALLPLAAPGSPEFMGLAALLALVVGATRVAIGFLRAGSVAYLMSQPVLQGFTSAAAILIVGSQLPGALGVQAPGDGVLGRAVWALGQPGEWEMASLALTAATVAVVFLSRKIHPLVPGVLLATAAGLAFSVLSGYQGPRIGAIPAGLPPISLDLPWTALPSLALPGVVIALVGFAEAASISRTFAAQDRTPWDPSREFVSQGVANLASGLSGGFPVGGSFSRSSINRLAGAGTRWSGAVTGLVVLVFLPFAQVLAPLPRAILSAIVIAAVVTLIRIPGLLRIWQFSKPQALIAWHTFALTIVLAPRLEQAVVLGILFALGVHLWREMPLGLDSWTEGATLHLAPKGVLWFGSAPGVERVMRRSLAAAQNVKDVAVHLGGLGRLDYTGALFLRDLRQDAESRGLQLRLEDVPPHAHRIVRSVLDWEPHRDEHSQDSADAQHSQDPPHAPDLL